MKGKPKGEDYFLDHAPIEMTSVLLKLIVEILVKLGAVTAPEQIPHSISRLLYQANAKSDLETEHEIYESFLNECKVMIDKEYEMMQSQIKTHKELKELGALEIPDKIDLPHFTDLRNEKLAA